MARPGRPERNRAAPSFRQLRRFHPASTQIRFSVHTGCSCCGILAARLARRAASSLDHRHRVASRNQIHRFPPDASSADPIMPSPSHGRTHRKRRFWARATAKRDHVARLAHSSSPSSNRITVAGATTTRNERGRQLRRPYCNFGGCNSPLNQASISDNRIGSTLSHLTHWNLPPPVFIAMKCIGLLHFGQVGDAGGGRVSAMALTLDQARA
jgi:hypothetical protein